MDGLSVIGGMLLDCVPTVKEKALNALNNLSMNIKNQEEIQVSLLQGKNKMLKCLEVRHESSAVDELCTLKPNR